MLLYPSFWADHTENPTYFLETATDVDGMEFGTQLHGGFASCKFNILGSFNHNWRRYRRLFNSHCVIFDMWGRRAYEGRVQDLVLLNNRLSVSIDGHYSHGSEVIQGMIYLSTGDRGTPLPVYDVVEDCIELSYGLTGDTKVWNQKFGFVDPAANVDVTALNGKDYTQAKLYEVLEEVLKLGYKDTDARPIYFAIWNNRIPHLFVEPNLQVPVWMVSAFNVEEGLTLARSRADIFNKIWGLYEGSTGSVLTSTAATDPISRDLYGVKEGIVNVGQMEQTQAEAMRDMALERNAFARQMYSLPVGGIVRHWSGMLDYPFRMRAGDVVMFMDVDPYTAHVDSPWSEMSAGITGMIVNTTYSADDNLMQLEVNSKDTRLETWMARLGLSGGLS